MSSQRICPLEHAGALDISARKLFHNPRNILKPYIHEGMNILDFGCGPGFFTMEIAKLAGGTGRVTAADLQEGMLSRLKAKLQNTIYADRVHLHLCGKEKTGLSEKYDLILLFYMLHEVPDQSAFLLEMKTLLNSDGKILIVEPKFHVSKQGFIRSISLIKQIGFEVLKGPKVFFSRSVVIKKMLAG